MSKKVQSGRGFFAGHSASGKGKAASRWETAFRHGAFAPRFSIFFKFLVEKIFQIVYDETGNI